MLRSLLCLMALSVPSVGAFLVFSPGRCPSVPVKQNFNLTAYTGSWYSYENFDAPYQFGMSCVRATYGLLGGGRVSVVNDGFSEIRVAGFSLYKRTVRADGVARILDWSDPARLYVSFGGQPDLSIGGTKPNYMVVDTDYKTYSLVYSCSYLIVPFRLEGAWILTRHRGVRPKNIFELENKLASYGIDIKNFKKVEHTNC